MGQFYLVKYSQSILEHHTYNIGDFSWRGISSSSSRLRLARTASRGRHRIIGCLPLLSRSLSSRFRHSSSYLLVSRGGSLLSSRTYRPPRTLRRLSGRRIRPRGSGWRRPRLIGSTSTMFISASTTYCLTQLRDILRTADTMADPYDALRAEFIRQFSPNVHEQLNKLVFAPRARRPSSYTADEDPPCVPASW